MAENPQLIRNYECTASGKNWRVSSLPLKQQQRKAAPIKNTYLPARGRDASCTKNIAIEGKNEITGENKKYSNNYDKCLITNVKHATPVEDHKKWINDSSSSSVSLVSLLQTPVPRKNAPKPFSHSFHHNKNKAHMRNNPRMSRKGNYCLS